MSLSAALVIEVWDTSLEPPYFNTPKTDAEHGRGLQLVDALSVRWGFYYARIGGKVIWCELGLAGGKVGRRLGTAIQRPSDGSSKPCRH